MENPNWILGECPNFSNNIDFKFDWGYADVYFEVDRGFVSKVKVYSDSLFPQIIDEI